MVKGRRLFRAIIDEFEKTKEEDGIGEVVKIVFFGIQSDSGSYVAYKKFYFNDLKTVTTMMRGWFQNSAKCLILICSSLVVSILYVWLL